MSPEVGDNREILAYFLSICEPFSFQLVAPRQTCLRVFLFRRHQCTETKKPHNITCYKVFQGGRWDWLLRSLTLASLNAFPLCSPQGHLRTPRTSQKVDKSTPSFFVTTSFKQAWFVVPKNKRLFCSGGRWGCCSLLKILTTSIYRPFQPLFFTIWSHIGLRKNSALFAKVA